MDWICNITKKLQILNLSEQNASSKDIRCKINWVYGYNCTDIKRPLEYIDDFTDEMLLYFTANIVVIYHMKKHIQTH